ncbi:PilN domain-containing protein [candidate division KSB1 bacterium]|nr:PilN domain-containing protein [candidate division KSB1 bacterium]
MQMDKDIIHVLRMISSIIPDKLTLTNYQYAPFKEITSGRGNQARRSEQTQNENELGLRLSGMSKTPWPDVGVSVTQFILDLEKSGFFKEVDLSQEKFDVEEKLYVFTILTKLKGSESGANQ